MYLTFCNILSDNTNDLKTDFTTLSALFSITCFCRSLLHISVTSQLTAHTGSRSRLPVYHIIYIRARESYSTIHSCMFRVADEKLTPIRNTLRWSERKGRSYCLSVVHPVGSGQLLDSPLEITKLTKKPECRKYILGKTCLGKVYEERPFPVTS